MGSIYRTCLPYKGARHGAPSFWQARHTATVIWQARHGKTAVFPWVIILGLAPLGAHAVGINPKLTPGFGRSLSDGGYPTLCLVQLLPKYLTTYSLGTK